MGAESPPHCAHRTADQTDLLRADQSDLLLADQSDLLPISTKSRKADQTDLPLTCFGLRLGQWGCHFWNLHQILHLHGVPHFSLSCHSCCAMTLHSVGVVIFAPKGAVQAELLIPKTQLFCMGCGHWGQFSLNSTALCQSLGAVQAELLIGFPN